MSETLTGTHLDAQIATRIFGWEDVEQMQTSENYRGGPPGSEYWSPVPPYSTTWEGAGLVVERMIERGWSPSISHSRGQWSVLFVTAGCSYDVMGEAGPQTICLCALAALAAAALAATETGG